MRRRPARLGTRHWPDGLQAALEAKSIAVVSSGADSARVLALCVHPYISGVPHRIAQFERIFDEITRRPGVLFWTNEQILDWYKATQAGG